MNDQERREYRQAIDNLTRLIDWLEQHGIGSEVGVRSTVADHEARINALERGDFPCCPQCGSDDWRVVRADRGCQPGYAHSWHEGVRRG